MPSANSMERTARSCPKTASRGWMSCVLSNGRLEGSYRAVRRSTSTRWVVRRSLIRSGSPLDRCRTGSWRGEPDRSTATLRGLYECGQGHRDSIRALFAELCGGSMRAAVISSPGGPEVFEIRELEDPRPGPDEALVAVH